MQPTENQSSRALFLANLREKLEKEDKIKALRREPDFTVSTAVAGKLERMRLIKAVLNSDLDEPMGEEFNLLIDEMVELFLPFIKKLAKAGLLSMNLDLEGIDLTKFRTLFGEPKQVYRNGGIWIDCEHSGGMVHGALWPTIGAKPRPARPSFL